MSDARDLEAPLITPLVKPLTVSPTILGVPYAFFMFAGVATAVIFLASKNLLMLLSCLPIYAAGRILTLKDARIFEILGVRARRCPPRSRSLWGCDSYQV
jgi:type IV secretion system protein VirB3